MDAPPETAFGYNAARRDSSRMSASPAKQKSEAEIQSQNPK